MIKEKINRWKGTVSRIKDKLVKMIKDVNSKFDDYSISLKIRQILLHWSYELTEKDFFKLNKLMYKNELLSIQQKRSITKKKRKLF